TIDNGCGKVTYWFLHGVGDLLQHSRVQDWRCGGGDDGDDGDNDDLESYMFECSEYKYIDLYIM
ncbi:Hypothetical predicted protein, partial [Pelobates cultripes]